MGNNVSMRRFSAKTAAGYLAVLTISSVFYAYLQWGMGFADPDSFYHMKLTLLTIKDGPIREFPWLPLSVLAQGFADHHFLYHLILIPFFLVAGPFIGIKVATTFLAATATAAFYGLLRSLDLKRHAFLLTVLLIFSAGFFFRINLAKTPAVALIWFFLELYAIIRGKNWLLFGLAFSHVWLHGSWTVLPIVILFHLFSVWAVRRADDSSNGIGIVKTAWETIKALRLELAATAGGLIAGLIVNPFFPENLRFYWEQVVQIALINHGNIIEVGQEWYGFGPFDIMRHMPIVIAVMAATMVGIAIRHRKPGQTIRTDDRRTVTVLLFGILTLFFAVMTFRQRRHMEYLVPVTVIMIGLIADTFLPDISLRKLWSESVKRAGNRFLPIFLSVTIITAISAIVASDASKTRHDYENLPANHYGTAMTWVEENVPAGEIIINPYWDIFPPVFYQNDNYRWFGGLDPTFTYRADPERWQSMSDIMSGKDGADAAGFLDSVGSRHLFLRTDRTIPATISHDSRLELVYHDQYAAIYRIIRQ